MASMKSSNPSTKQWWCLLRQPISPIPFPPHVFYPLFPFLAYVCLFAHALLPAGFAIHLDCYLKTRKQITIIPLDEFKGILRLLDSYQFYELLYQLSKKQQRYIMGTRLHTAGGILWAALLALARGSLSLFLVSARLTPAAYRM